MTTFGSQEVPARPDLDEPFPPARRRRRLFLPLAVVVALAAVGTTVALVGGSTESGVCRGTGSAAPTEKIGPRWEAGRTYCFRLTSTADGELIEGGSSESHSAKAVETFQFRIVRVDPDGSVDAVMKITDESLVVDGRSGELRPPLTVTVHLDPVGTVTSQFGEGVPTGISEGSGLPSPGQFVPLFEPRVVAVGESWSETLTMTSASAGSEIIEGSRLEGTFVGQEELSGREADHLSVSIAMPAGDVRMDLDQLAADQGVSSGMPAGAAFVMKSWGGNIDQQVFVDSSTQELLRMTSSTTMKMSDWIEGLPKGDPNAARSTFDGTITVTLERIFD